jgi:PilZ domain
MAINQSIVRYCQRCGSSTLWKQPDSAGQADAAGSSVRDHRQAVHSARGDVTSPEVGGAEEDVLAPGRRGEPPIAPAPWRDGKRPSVAAQPPPAFAGAAWTEAEAADSRNVPATEKEPGPNRDVLSRKYTDGGSTAESPASNVLSSRAAPKEPENRRKHVRTRVSLKACVRRPGQTDEVVACEDMSRGGLRFKSTRKYVEKMMIEVAVPYSPGDQAIFVPAQIAYVQELPEQKKYRCGATYLRATK